MNIPNVNPLISNGSSREKMHCLADAYLSPLRVSGDTILNSTTYNHHTYHLLERKQTPCSLLSTALKVISYCTMILPMFAAITWYATKDRSGSYFLKKNYTYHEIKGDLRSDSVRLKVLHQLMPEVLHFTQMSKEPDQESPIDGALYHADLQAIKAMTMRDGNILTKASLPALKQAATQISEMHDLLNPVYLKRTNS